MVQGFMVYWDVKLLDALWAYRTTYEATTKLPPINWFMALDKRLDGLSKAILLIE